MKTHLNIKKQETRNKKLVQILACGVAMALANTAVAQFNSPWTVNTSNSSQSGYIGIGTSTSTNNSPLANFNLHVHGVVDYVEAPLSSGNPNSLILNYEMESLEANNAKSGLNYGKTARFGLTNSTTGRGSLNGATFMMSEKNLTIVNREDGNMTLSVPGIGLHFLSAYNRITTTGLTGVNASDKFAKLNIGGNDNGLSIRTTGGNHYALRLRVQNDNNYLIQGFGNNDNVANFRVTGNGYVYARRYITTLNPFPDYVFNSDYNLLTFNELRMFIAEKKHLPNMPTAEEVEENGADIGEINRVLVEKVEELTLYILQLEERLKTLEDE